MYLKNNILRVNDKEVSDYLLDLGIEVGDCYYMSQSQQLTIELKSKITIKQIQKVEMFTSLRLDSIRLNYNHIEDSSCVDLTFKR